MTTPANLETPAARRRILGGFRWYTFLTAFLVLPNLPLLLAAHPLSLLLRGYINLDYLLIGILSLFIPRIFTFLLLFTAILLDFIHAACVTYLFSPAEFLQVTRYGGLLSTTRIGLIAAAFVLTLLICLATTAFTSRHAPRRERRIAIVTTVVLIVALALADLRSGRQILLVQNEAAPARLTRSPTLGLLYSQYIYDRYARGLRLGGLQAMPSATALALNRLQDYKAQKLQPNVVLVLVESWGVAHDPTLRHTIAEPYSDPRLLARYNVLRGTMPFEGATTSGEGRELCQSRLGSYITQGTTAQLDRCVPERLRRMGYHTLAVHGFDGEMYDRKAWYPKMGFDDMWFHDRLQAAGLPDCAGPFPGTCDKAVATWIAGRLQQPSDEPLFVHWVTLSSHLPIWGSVEKASAPYCGVSSGTRDDLAICSWAHLIATTNQSVLDLALGQLARPTIFVIVGDHAPPFDKDSERAQFSSSEVPYVILLPRMSQSR